ncbi:protein of unknown function [Streptomyces murinus]
MDHRPRRNPHRPRHGGRDPVRTAPHPIQRTRPLRHHNRPLTAALGFRRLRSPGRPAAFRTP